MLFIPAVVSLSADPAFLCSPETRREPPEILIPARNLSSSREGCENSLNFYRLPFVCANKHSAGEAYFHFPAVLSSVKSAADVFLYGSTKMENKKKKHGKDTGSQKQKAKYQKDSQTGIRGSPVALRSADVVIYNPRSFAVFPIFRSSEIVLCFWLNLPPYFFSQRGAREYRASSIFYDRVSRASNCFCLY